MRFLLLKVKMMMKFLKMQAVISVFCWNKPTEDSVILDRSKLRKAVHHDLCSHNQKIFEPLFLRKCEPQRVRQGSAPPNVFPILKVEIIGAYKKSSGHSALLTSLNSPTYCVRYLESNAVHKPKNVLVYVSPMYFVRFIARPEPQRTNQYVFEDSSEIVSLLMSPEDAIVAKKMLPKWQTVTFTLAFGKHVAVKYRIIEVRKEPVVHVKLKLIMSNAYQPVLSIKVEYWSCFKVNELKLSTVEKCDPQMVKRVFLEQQSMNLTSWNPSSVRVSEVEEDILEKKKS
uniref:DUF667 domain-containing protein n=1 Tax=Caenorhabditis tropicalis TaxID=1561998 RepID=A0A1I7TJX5_9PELO